MVTTKYQLFIPCHHILFHVVTKSAVTTLNVTTWTISHMHTAEVSSILIIAHLESFLLSALRFVYVTRKRDKIVN